MKKTMVDDHYKYTNPRPINWGFMNKPARTKANMFLEELLADEPKVSDICEEWDEVMGCDHNHSCVIEPYLLALLREFRL